MAENMIKFLRGNVANLPANATAGAVYFTKDEGLYLGLEDGSYHRYGDFITVADVASLPESGAHETCMYYCETENILAKWDGSKWVQINKQKTLAELGGVAKSVYDAKMTALEKADSDNAAAIEAAQKDVDDLEKYVGTIPNGEDGQPMAASVVAYINKKTDGIATSGNLEALAGRVTTAEGDIDNLETAVKALQDANAEGGAVAEAIEAAADAAADAQADVDALELKVGTVAEGKTVVGLIDDAQKQADKGVEDAANAQAKADSAYTLAEGKATMDQVNTAIANAGHAVKADVDTALENLDKAYKAADQALETKLQANIDAKVAQADYDVKVDALTKEDVRLAGLISDMDTAYKAADEALDGRVATLEGTITGLSGAMHFKGVKDAIPSDVAGYADGDVIVVGEKEYVFNDGAFVEFGDVSAEGDRIAALEGVVGKAAEGENAATGLVKAAADNAAAIAAEKERAEGIEADLAQADIDNLAAAKKYTDDEIAELNIAQYAKQADLEGHMNDKVAHITAAERTAWNAAEQNAKDYADGLDDAMNARVEALEAIDHDHGNKTVLDGITAEKVAAWDAAQANAEATAAGALASAKTELEGKITSGDAATLAAAKEDAQGKVDALANGQVKLNTEAIATKANSADVYKKTETYTQTEVDEAIAAAVTAAHTWGTF